MKPSIFDTRRDNLRQLLEQWGGPTSLSQKLGYANGSYLAQLAGPNPSRDVSEKVARHIEATLDLEPGWLDHAQRKTVSQPDTNALIDLVALIQDVLNSEEVKPSKAKFAEIVSLVYEHTQSSEEDPAAYVRRLVQLIK